MKIKEAIKKGYLSANGQRLFRWVPDKWLIFALYTAATGKLPHLHHPLTFNEKIQWMKLYDHNPLYTMIADKYAVRQYVKEKVGEKYLVPLLGKWDSPLEIDFRGLPQQFVLKCNHDSGGVVICDDRDRFDREAAIKKLQYHYRHNQYYVSREWAYKDIRKCVTGEKYLMDQKVKELRDYKFFCFGGVPQIIQVDFGRQHIHKRNLYTPDWQFLDFTIKCPNDRKAAIEKPENLDEMLKVAAKLSRGFLQVRVDLYSVNGETYFGEMTLYHGGGIEPFSSQEYAVKMGNWIDLSKAYGIQNT